MMISNEQMILRLAAAALLGGIVGWNRERLDWAAGLRTHMLVCLGSCLFMLVSSYGFMDILGYPHIQLDPSRVASQVVPGIGFLGAGTIIFRRNVIRGLTTAASLWAVAAVGLATGGGMVLGAAVTTLFIVAILSWLKPLEDRVFQKQKSRAIQLLIGRDVSLFDIEAALKTSDIHLKHIVVKKGDTPEIQRVEVIINGANQQNLLPLLDKLRSLKGVLEVSSASS